LSIESPAKVSIGAAAEMLEFMTAQMRAFRPSASIVVLQSNNEDTT